MWICQAKIEVHSLYINRVNSAVPSKIFCASTNPSPHHASIQDPDSISRKYPTRHISPNSPQDNHAKTRSAQTPKSPAESPAKSADIAPVKNYPNTTEFSRVKSLTYVILPRFSLPPAGLLNATYQTGRAPTQTARLLHGFMVLILPHQSWKTRMDTWLSFNRAINSTFGMQRLMRLRRLSLGIYMKFLVFWRRKRIEETTENWSHCYSRYSMLVNTVYFKKN